MMKFILDPTSLPEIIRLWQTCGPEILAIVFYLTRTFVYALHRKKLILVGKWPYVTKNENCLNIPNKSNPLCIAGESSSEVSTSVHDQAQLLTRQGVPGVPVVPVVVTWSPTPLTVSPA